ncbi:MAG TPA: UDP-N-acetylmuramoyl-L-alanine--D-glutamate ligase [Acetomicrobium flavidum]|uniref:UDP-N-acetylmuramoyl-L-alanine--D-glutamate ligase n=1 Tax=Acetomicrobium flavidum TaxID=49896 RepID=UPI002BA90A87|nr:UDP-N-acetylmuramoyl-L-alanine--D-glutamate ligase [Acetomicrobium flavidum]
MKITVVGSGVSGKALALFAKNAGFDVFVTEQNKLDDDTKELYDENGIKWEEGGHTRGLLDCDLLVLSSGVSEKSIPVKMARQEGLPLKGELDFIYPYLSGKIIGVTGTNGKSTTAALVHHLLTKLGYNAALAGNFGIPLANFAMKKFDYIVIEVSSFQLHWATHFSFDIAIVTNICPDHIDWHGSFEAYVKAKRRIIDLLAPDGYCIYRTKEEDLLQIGNRKGARLYWSSNTPVYGNAVQDDLVLSNSEVVLMANDHNLKLFSPTTLPLFGRHNVENAAMAMAAVYYLGRDVNKASKSLLDFKNLPHRCERVGEKDGVLFIDDSKGTNVASTITAITSIPGRKVVILGGRGKGEQYDELAKVVKEHVKAAVLLGEEKEAISKALEETGFYNFYFVSSMEEAVSMAFKIADQGEIVLLSPACTSWDMYKNYHERGMHFQKIVKEIVKADTVKNG